MKDLYQLNNKNIALEKDNFKKNVLLIQKDDIIKNKNLENENLLEKFKVLKVENLEKSDSKLLFGLKSKNLGYCLFVLNVLALCVLAVFEMQKNDFIASSLIQ